MAWRRMWKVYIAYATKKAATRVSNRDMTCVPDRKKSEKVSALLYLLYKVTTWSTFQFLFLPAPAADSLSPNTVNAEEMEPRVTDMLT